MHRDGGEQVERLALELVAQHERHAVGGIAVCGGGIDFTCCPQQLHATLGIHIRHHCPVTDASTRIQPSQGRSACIRLCDELSNVTR